MTTLTTYSHHHHAGAIGRATRKLGIVTGATAALFAAAYGVSNYAQTTTQSSFAAELPAMPLSHRLVATGTLPSYILTADPGVVRDPTEWAASVERAGMVRREASTLQRLGFVAGIEEQLHGRYPLMSGAISMVEQYGSPAGARAELARQYARASANPAGSLKRLDIVGIPGAAAWEIQGAHGAAVNVGFSAGPYYYRVAGSLPTGGRAASVRAQIIRAAETNYLLVNGCVAPAAATHSNS